MDVMFSASDDIYKAFVSLAAILFYFNLLLYCVYLLIHYKQVFDFLDAVDRVGNGCKWLVFVSWKDIGTWDRLSKFLLLRDSTVNESIARSIIYDKANRRIQNAMKIFKWIFTVVQSSYFVPFPYVAFCWCLGNNTEKSWVFFFGFWWDFRNDEFRRSMQWSSFYSRTPFEVNSDFRLAALECFQCLCGAWACLLCRVYYTVLTECTFYISTVMYDIKMCFNQIDQMAANGTSEHAMLKCCRDALELHNRIHE